MQPALRQMKTQTAQPAPRVDHQTGRARPRSRAARRKVMAPLRQTRRRQTTRAWSRAWARQRETVRTRRPERRWRRRRGRRRRQTRGWRWTRRQTGRRPRPQTRASVPPQTATTPPGRPPPRMQAWQTPHRQTGRWQALLAARQTRSASARARPRATRQKQVVGSLCRTRSNHPPQRMARSTCRRQTTRTRAGPRQRWSHLPEQLRGQQLMMTLSHPPRNPPTSTPPPTAPRRGVGRRWCQRRRWFWRPPWRRRPCPAFFGRRWTGSRCQEARGQLRGRPPRMRQHRPCCQTETTWRARRMMNWLRQRRARGRARQRRMVWRQTRHPWQRRHRQTRSLQAPRQTRCHPHQTWRPRACQNRQQTCPPAGWARRKAMTRRRPLPRQTQTSAGRQTRTAWPTHQRRPSRELQKQTAWRHQSRTAGRWTQTATLRVARQTRSPLRRRHRQTRTSVVEGRRQRRALWMHQTRCWWCQRRWVWLCVGEGGRRVEKRERGGGELPHFSHPPTHTHSGQRRCHPCQIRRRHQTWRATRGARGRGAMRRKKPRAVRVTGSVRGGRGWSLCVRVCVMQWIV